MRNWSLYLVILAAFVFAFVNVTDAPARFIVVWSGLAFGLCWYASVRYSGSIEFLEILPEDREIGQIVILIAIAINVLVAVAGVVWWLSLGELLSLNVGVVLFMVVMSVISSIVMCRALIDLWRRDATEGGKS